MLKWATNPRALNPNPNLPSTSTSSLPKPKSGSKLSDPGPAPATRLPCPLGAKLSDSAAPAQRPTQLPLFSSTSAPTHAAAPVSQIAMCASGPAGQQRATRSGTGIGIGAGGPTGPTRAEGPANGKLSSGAGIRGACVSSSAMSASGPSHSSFPAPRPDHTAALCSRASDPAPAPAPAPPPAQIETASYSYSNESGEEELWNFTSGFAAGRPGGSGEGLAGTWPGPGNLMVEFSSEDESGADDADEEPSPTSTSTGSDTRSNQCQTASGETHNPAVVQVLSAAALDYVASASTQTAVQSSNPSHEPAH